MVIATPPTIICYSGYKAEEKPLYMIEKGKKIRFETIEDSWREPGVDCYRVRAENGKRFLLQYCRGEDHWTVHLINDHKLRNDYGKRTYCKT